MSSAGRMQDRFGFDEPVESEDNYGGATINWTERHVCAGEIIYARGDEALAAARLEGRSVYKLKIRSCAVARGIKAGWRARDTRRAVSYNIREVDVVTDRAWIYLVVESGVAV